MDIVKTVTIRPAVVNTLKRVGIEYEPLLTDINNVTVYNRFSGESCITTPLIAKLISWVYSTSNDYEDGTSSVNLSDFDRIRYFILEQDSNAYTTCID